MGEIYHVKIQINYDLPLINSSLFYQQHYLCHVKKMKKFTCFFSIKNNSIIFLLQTHSRCQQTAKEAARIDIVATGGVRYTVPKYIRPENMEDTLTVRFRVGDVYQNCYVSVYFDDERVLHRKRPVVAPGEMEQVILKKDDLLNVADNINIAITES